jgi:signal transduction histidine kinase
MFPLVPTGIALLFMPAIGAWFWLRQRKLQKSLAEKEMLNAKLEHRIETTKANLLVSESARRRLEVANAVTDERERMMREIHDGIGSSLVAALASAERQGKQGSTAVFALKGALSDLRIAVDSLEPVEGDVTTLLASLRYRLEPEMKKSGVSFDWRVEEVPTIPWLDAPNAIHLLRIFQETFGNILGHAQASVIRVDCKAELRQGRPGVSIEVSDNGMGFDASVPTQGHGRKNMKSRADALGARLHVESAPGKGSHTSLWLPLIREK